MLKVLIAAGILFYMFLFWWFKPARIFLPCGRRIYPVMSECHDEKDTEVVVWNESLQCLTLQKGDAHENP